MSTAPLVLDPETPAPVEEGPEAGVVYVHLLGFCHTTGRCSCGWTGRRRLLRAAAEQDAWAHAAQRGCTVASPLILAW
ncbi:hypothetical protein [Mycolicibacterium sp. 050158]|jgi:hypothetical protein|uniref:hypothetical protein n=1 Tax=Mycolicibacterium sp. 050158 TaxID=3090602 RepID=UPI00299DC33D|nr:hypothetical protein [Mycolicibacterium sp. 050158]MDX1891814.1 hypothetical protein [Mycolicibacterium sp. 050158]